MFIQGSALRNLRRVFFLGLRIDMQGFKQNMMYAVESLIDNICTPSINTQTTDTPGVSQHVVGLWYSSYWLQLPERAKLTLYYFSYHINTRIKAASLFWIGLNTMRRSFKWSVLWDGNMASSFINNQILFGAVQKNTFFPQSVLLIFDFLALHVMYSLLIL